MLPYYKIPLFTKNGDEKYMNRQEMDLLNILSDAQFENQRLLAEVSGYSLGSVNRALRNLISAGYLNDDMDLTQMAKEELAANAPRNAIILAAGVGMRMVPVNTETSKGLIEVGGEPLIERIISQLHEAGIYEIHIVVGFMKESYEYLIDKYGVDLLVNAEYATKNNIHSLKKALCFLSNTYIVPCDIWCAKNPFRRNEMYSWYMVNDTITHGSTVRVNRKQELIISQSRGNMMIGIAYLLESEACILRERVEALCQNFRHDNDFWEVALYEKNRMIVQARLVNTSDVIEINTYEQLRELDSNSGQLYSDTIRIIAETFGVYTSEVKEISVLKKGMTNRSFMFSCKGKRYIMRIPGEGTDQLIDRSQEAAVYRALAGKNITDSVMYINPQNGYKITEFLPGARNSDAFCIEDITLCMEKLREFHEMELQVDHEFDIFGQINFYESLWNNAPSVYQDYQETKHNVFTLKSYIDAVASKKVLTHIDAVADNFLFFKNENGEEELRLIDWEYAGMQDPHVDIAMFCIYSMYNRQQVDQLIDLYFVEGCKPETRIKIYCYISACGLLWSNWCEYKRSLGVEFGEYSLKQYRFAKEYYRIVQQALQELEDE